MYACMYECVCVFMCESVCVCECVCGGLCVLWKNSDHKENDKQQTSYTKSIKLNYIEQKKEKENNGERQRQR